MTNCLYLLTIIPTLDSSLKILGRKGFALSFLSTDYDSLDSTIYADAFFSLYHVLGSQYVGRLKIVSIRLRFDASAMCDIGLKSW